MTIRLLLMTILFLFIVSYVAAQRTNNKVIEIFTTVEQMPMYPGCYELEMTHKQMDSCTRRNVDSYISKYLKYPDEAIAIKKTGTVVVQFIVNRSGKFENIRIVKSLGHGCDEEAIRLISIMNDKVGLWDPGKQRGVPTKVLYTMPIHFKLGFQ